MSFFAWSIEQKNNSVCKVDILKGLDFEDILYSDGEGKRSLIGHISFRYEKILKNMIEIYFKEGKK